MLRTRLLRSVVAFATAILIASCADSIATSPTAPVDAVPSHDSGSGDSGSSQGSGSSQLELRAVWWKTDHENVRVSQAIGPAGGTISIPETGLTIQFPAGAVRQLLTITITADENYVAYKMDPSGTTFLKDVQVTQSLATTSMFGEPLKSQLYAAYIADDNVQLSGNVPVTEIEPSKTIFSDLDPRLPQAQVWVIRHFSRYMLASN